MADGQDKPMLDYGNLRLGINAVCDQLDALGLTLPERWWVCHHVAAAAAAMLGEKMSEIAEASGPAQGSTQ